MKKKLLIVNKSFELGGIQMALANLLDAICDEYDITLAVFNPRGPLRDRIPENVRILKLSPLTEVLGMTGADCKKYGTITQRVFKLAGTVWSKLFSNSLPVSLALAFQKNLGEFDAVISYHQETTSKTMVTGFGRFALKKCKAQKRIAWVHADFLATKLATASNLKTYMKFDKIVSVSKTAMDHFISAYPNLKDKCDYCYNPIPVADIVKKSTAETDVFTRHENDLILFSACRLVQEKGLVQALYNMIPVFTKHRNLKWFIAGVGPEESKLLSVIGANQLENQVILLGFKHNPYPYIKDADFLFIPSVHETFGMVVAEAYVLGTPVIASDIPIMREILGENDYLCGNNDYATVVEGLIKKDDFEVSPPNTMRFLDWKKQFERVLQW